MTWIQIIVTALGVLASLFTILGGMYKMIKFLLKDIQKEVHEIKENMNTQVALLTKRIDESNSRMDGLYRVILDRTYGKNIPEELK